MIGVGVYLKIVFSVFGLFISMFLVEVFMNILMFGDCFGFIILMLVRLLLLVFM